MSREPTVRIVVGDLSPTGVPVVLCRLLEWARDHVGARFDVVALRGGLLADRVRSAATTLTILEPGDRRSLADGAGAALVLAGHPSTASVVRATAWRRRTRHLPAPSVLLVHGAGGWPMVPTVGSHVPLVVHLHEMDVAMARSIPSGERPALYRRARRVMVVTRSVGDLAVRDGADRDAVVVVPGVVADPVGPPARPGGPATPGDRPVVAAIGTPGWRKGTDRFVALAHSLERSVPGARTVWVGGRPSGPEVAHVGSPDPVEWMPAGTDPWQHLGDASVLVIPSREEALPLVALEAAQLGVPIVAAAVGGLVDLLAEDRGVLVAGHDLRGLHAAVLDVLAHPDDAHARAVLAAEHVATRHEVDRVGPRWWEVVRGAAGG